MPVLFTKVTANSKLNSYSYKDGYIPDALIYNLGANDYSNIIKPITSTFIYGY